MRSLALCCLAMFFSMGNALADDPVTIKERQIRAVDAQGNPIEGVIADAWLINERYFWPSKILPRQPAVTDAQGIASIRYPDTALYGVASIPVESVKMTLSHADYCGLDVVVPIGGEDQSPYDVQLTQGIFLALGAVEATGQPVKEPFAIMTANAAMVNRWNRPSPDRANCRSMKSGNQQIMLVQPDPKGLHRFSEILSYHFDSELEPEVVLDDIELRQGVPIRGKLSSNVPRPVKDGSVVAVHAPLPAGDSSDDKLPSLLFSDTVNIKEDGTFEFPSMPHTGRVQLIAICRGWVGKQEESTPFIVGELFDVLEGPVDVELTMEPTFDAKIQVVDQEELPVEGVVVATSPNQKLQLLGSNILGSPYTVLPGLIQQVSNPTDMSPIEIETSNRYQAISDADGRLTIRDLPRNRWSASFAAWSGPKCRWKIKTNAGEDIEGLLPAKEESEVEFQITVQVLGEK